jgi:hypothetical protein
LFILNFVQTLNICIDVCIIWTITGQHPEKLHTQLLQ